MNTTTTNEQQYMMPMPAPATASKLEDVNTDGTAFGQISIMNETGGMNTEESFKELTLSEHRKEFIYETFVERPVAVPQIIQHKKIMAMGKDQPSIMRRVNNNIN